MFGRQHHVSGAEERVRAGGKDADFLVGTGDLEIDFGAFGAADPVALHLLEGVAPINGIEVLEETLGIGGDAQHPLAHRLAHDREAAHFALAVDHFLIGQNRAQLLTPPNGRLGDIGQALGVAIGAAAGFQFRSGRAGAVLKVGRVG